MLTAITPAFGSCRVPLAPAGLFSRPAPVPFQALRLTEMSRGRTQPTVTSKHNPAFAVSQRVRFEPFFSIAASYRESGEGTPASRSCRFCLSISPSSGS